MSDKDDSTVKMVTPEQLEELKGLQNQFDHLTKKYGELHYQKKLIEAELHATDAAMDELEEHRLNIIQSISEQLGSSGGEIDLNTGEFIPNQQ